ncbi:uncharacterized protein LOC128669594 [Plodia interpunctella]|uniref:uncharacterized protein LOC128669594 n=1 Tax=Plodia interpunctella TaxID=58824 RepID=UPI002367C1FD|nr:uncharacterized protein LOC128669594 [Plodia interpunctella]
MLESSFPVEIENQDMKNALFSIALELKRLCKPQDTEIFTTSREVNSDDIDNMIMVKSQLSMKNKEMKKLRKNMKMACVVANAVISAKEDETAYLTKHIEQSRDQCQCLLRKNIYNAKVIEDLKSEGQNLRDEKEVIEMYINLGYEQLQKMRNLPYKEIPITQMLKEIIVSCGEYYSDYDNERSKIINLERRNKFLSTHISVLKNSNKALTEELVSLRTQNMKLNSEIQTNKLNSSNATGVQDFDNRSALYTFDSKKSTLSSDDQNCNDKSTNLNFNSHLTTIKKLLYDQDDMLKSLRKISEELTLQEH